MKTGTLNGDKDKKNKRQPSTVILKKAAIDFCYLRPKKGATTSRNHPPKKTRLSARSFINYCKSCLKQTLSDA